MSHFEATWLQVFITSILSGGQRTNPVTPNQRTLVFHSMTTISLPTTAFYDAWSMTYDTDRNVLQMVDDALIIELLPTLIPNAPITLLDLGCGTGRNTQKLCAALPPGSTLIAVDASPAMLEGAKKRVGKSDVVDIQWVNTPMEELGDIKVDAVVCTLVLEHVPLGTFFGIVGGILKTGGWLYVSDMHPDMGREAQANFVGSDGIRRIGTSTQYTIEDTISAAEKAGLALRGDAIARGVDDEEHAARFGSRAAGWIGKMMLVGMIFDGR